MPNRVPNPGAQHPERWRDDLNPDALAGANIGTAGPHPELDSATAYGRKGLHQQLRNYTDDELKQIPVLPEGSRLEQGATYIDLAADAPQEFTATGGMKAEANNCYVPKSAVDYTIWNRLIGVRNPERLGADR
jgi:hypothetical protein